MATTWAEDAGVETTSAFDASLWDPLFSVACDLVTWALRPMRDKIVYAFGVLHGVAGGPELDPDSLDLDGYLYLATRCLLDTSEMPEAQTRALNQRLAAGLYFGRRLANPCDAEYYHAHLNRLAADADASFRLARGSNRLLYATRLFLARCGVDRPEDTDLAFALCRWIAPDLARAAEIVRTSTGYACAAGLGLPYTVDGAGGRNRQEPRAPRWN